MRTTAALIILALSLAATACRSEPASDKTGNGAEQERMSEAAVRTEAPDGSNSISSSGKRATPLRGHAQPSMAGNPADGALRYQEKAREVTRQMQDQTTQTEEYLDR